MLRCVITFYAEDGEAIFIDRTVSVDKLDPDAEIARMAGLGARSLTIEIYYERLEVVQR